MIEVRDISKKFGNKIAISNISCSFEPKKVTTIIGPSGSGKTTLMRCMNKLETPDSGVIILNNQDIAEIKQSKLSQKVGIVFQHFNLFNHMNVLENLLYAPKKLLKFSDVELKQKAENLLTKLNIKEKSKLYPCELSGGQKQRVAIARSLMMDPEVIIFDEPTSALDPESIKEILEIINDLKKDYTIVVITHHVKFAEKIADKVIFMDKGKLLCEQDSESFFIKPNSIRARIYLDSVRQF